MLPVLRRKNNVFDKFCQFDFLETLDSTFNSFFDSGWKKNKDGNYVFEIDVPGFNKDNLNVELNEGTITIKGETESRKMFKRFQININHEIEASIKDGILFLTLITPPEKQPKKIELN